MKTRRAKTTAPSSQRVARALKGTQPRERLRPKDLRQRRRTLPAARRLAAYWSRTSSIVDEPIRSNSALAPLTNGAKSNPERKRPSRRKTSTWWALQAFQTSLTSRAMRERTGM